MRRIQEYGKTRRVLFLLAAGILLLGGTRAAQAASTKGLRLAVQVGVVNVNTADGAQLQLLPGIGPKKAAAILAQRLVRPFRSVDDLTRVRGIGRKTVLRLRPLVTVSGPTTLGAETSAAGQAEKGSAGPSTSDRLPAKAPAAPGKPTGAANAKSTGARGASR